MEKRLPGVRPHGLLEGSSAKHECASAVRERRITSLTRKDGAIQEADLGCACLRCRRQNLQKYVPVLHKHTYQSDGVAEGQERS